jgi:hypothetical protein
MAEIYKDQTSPIKTKIFWGGEITNADNDEVTAIIFDITEDNTINPTVDPNQAILILEATKVETDNGTYQVIIPFDFCRRNRKFKIVWNYEIDGNSASHIYYTDVVTPYANLSDVWDDLNFGTDPSDQNYKTYHEVQMAEKYARKLIEIYTNQFFYEYDDRQIVYGHGSDILPLPFRISAIHELYENDILLVDKINEVNNWIYDPQISESGFGVRVNKQLLMDNMVYVSNGMVPPTINDWGGNYAFKKDYRYAVQGRFGWSAVPDNVEEACIILIQQFFEKDSAWRNKYVKSISSFDMQFEYMEDAHRGTGNLYADQLLTPYVINGMVAF